MSTPDAVGNKEAPSQAECGSCGRYIGPVLTCPYCGAAAEGRFPIQTLRWAALLLGVFGLLVFYALAWRSELPVTAVSTLKPSMQNARIRIKGEVVTKPYVLKREGAPNLVTFDVDDGTGRITVAASRSAAVGIAATDRIPEKGAAVQATGTLNARPGRRLRLYLEAASSLRIERGASSPEAPRLPQSGDDPEDNQRDPS